MSVDVSIIICTRDRADSLRETLTSIGRTEVPAGVRAELLIVDNGSSDHTQKVIADAAMTNMPKRTVIEPRKGLSNARNRALHETAGEIIIFTDDDVRVSDGWIAAMCRPIKNRTADGVQGMILPAPHLRRPWLTGIYADALAIIEPGRTGAPTSLTGANMGFRRAVLEKVPGFEVELGAGAAGVGEDTLFGVQMTRAGFTLAYAEDSLVEHHFEAHRLEVDEFLKWADRAGRGSALMDFRWLARHPSSPAMTRAWTWMKYQVRRAISPQNGPVPAEWMIWYLWRLAYLKEAVRLRQGG